MTTAAELARRRWLVLASAVMSFFAVGTAFFNLATLIGPAATGAVRDAGAAWRTPWAMLAAAAFAGALIAIWIREPHHPTLSAVTRNAGGEML